MKRKTPRMIAIAGGKGGVGKTTVTTNLALTFAGLGMRVVVVDADLGAANLHTAFGVAHPKRGIAEFIDETVASLSEVLTEGPKKIQFVAGSSRPGSADLGAAQKLRLLRGMARLDADVVLVDVGAGSSYTVVDLVAMADHKIFVVCPQLTSVHNAYALLKSCVHRVVRKHASDETHRDLIDAALGHESKTRTIPQLLGVIRPMDFAVADRIVDTLTRFGVMLVANQLTSPAEAEALRRMTPLIHDQLVVHAPLAAAIKRTPALAGGLQPGVGTFARANDEAAVAFRQLADAILSTDLAQLRGEARTTQQKTMPLWIQRGLEAEAAHE